MPEKAMKALESTCCQRDIEWVRCGIGRDDSLPMSMAVCECGSWTSVQLTPETRAWLDEMGTDA